MAKMAVFARCFLTSPSQAHPTMISMHANILSVIIIMLLVFVGVVLVGFISLTGEDQPLFEMEFGLSKHMEF